MLLPKYAADTEEKINHNIRTDPLDCFFFISDIVCHGLSSDPERATGDRQLLT